MMSQKACRNLYILYNIAEKPAGTRGSAPCSAERCERSLYRPQFQQRASAFYSEIQAGQGTSGDRSFRLLHLSEGRL